MQKRVNFKGYTRKDLSSLSEEDKLKYDKRSFKEYFKDTLFEDHPMISLYYTKSLMEPLNLKISHLFITTSLNLFFNAAFYSDDYIERTAKVYSVVNEGDVSIIITSQQPFITFSDIPKSIFALLASMLVEFFLLKIIEIPADVEEEFNNELITEDEEKIEVAQ